jgi:hypothetical protein
MPDQPIPAACPNDVRLHDDQLQAAILTQAFCVYPAPLTVEEIVLDLIGGSQTFMERDAAQNAVHCLLRDGVLRQSGSLILPVRAVVRYHELRDVI